MIQNSENHTLIDAHTYYGEVSDCLRTPPPSPPPSPPHPAKRTTLWEVATSGSITDVKGFVKVDWSPYPH